MKQMKQGQHPSQEVWGMWQHMTQLAQSVAAAFNNVFKQHILMRKMRWTLPILTHSYIQISYCSLKGVASLQIFLLRDLIQSSIS